MSKPDGEDGMEMRNGQRGQSGPYTGPLAAYDPSKHMGSVSVPNISCSTFVFSKAEDVRDAFVCAYGLCGHEKIDPRCKRVLYARLSGPTIGVAEDMMAAIEVGSKWAFLFPSGMGAIDTLARACCHPRLRDDGSVRDTVVHVRTLYGGTHALMHAILPFDGIMTVEVDGRDPQNVAKALLEYNGRVGLVFIETPANPTLEMVDIKAVAEILAKIPEDDRPVLAVDNTFMGIFQKPLDLGADVVMYSATKYLSGHADLIAGFLVGRAGRKVLLRNLEEKVVSVPLEVAIGMRRTICGYTPSSDMAQRLATHMQTYRLRMERQTQVAMRVAMFLREHPKVAMVNYPACFVGPDLDIRERQCSGFSAMMSFILKDDTTEAAYRFLNALKVVLRAVSLGAIRSLAENPRSMTHSDVPVKEQERLGISPSLIRLSVGIEDPEDLIRDLSQALDAV